MTAAGQTEGVRVICDFFDLYRIAVNIQSLTCKKTDKTTICEFFLSKKYSRHN